ncbi:uncharacterized protein LOC125504192 [Dendroctonus ponderosae]|uniref:uncharacterized protein LOC125504192 n=1 Tax=Dendroctonus ponderosae TaxID=77166 RepID=UPI002035C5CB|nr:uncharacterized protein LOC125504192 [Dendroctonus ponderosae]
MGRLLGAKAPTIRPAFSSRDRPRDRSTISSITCRRFPSSSRLPKCPPCSVFPPSPTCCQMCLTCNRGPRLEPPIRTYNFCYNISTRRKAETPTAPANNVCGTTSGRTE